MSSKKQNRSENTYMKINTIFKRDSKNIIMLYDSLVNKELEWLRNSNIKFEATEKIDGTNIRIELTTEIDKENYLRFYLDIKGKTDNAQIPNNLKEFLKNKFNIESVLKSLRFSKDCYSISNYNIDNYSSKSLDTLKQDHPEFFDKETGKLCIERIPKKYTLYGEGYGNKIQKVGSRYINKDVNFIGFDVKITSWNNTETYLLYDDKKSIFDSLDLLTVPIVGYYTIDEAIEKVKKGFKVTIPHDDETLIAEGLVMRTPVGMKFRNGSECIFKIKYKDFKDYYNKYGTYDKVEQIINEHI